VPRPVKHYGSTDHIFEQHHHISPDDVLKLDNYASADLVLIQ